MAAAAVSASVSSYSPLSTSTAVADALLYRSGVSHFTGTLLISNDSSSPSALVGRNSAPPALLQIMMLFVGSLGRSTRDSSIMSPAQISPLGALAALRIRPLRTPGEKPLSVLVFTFL